MRRLCLSLAVVVCLTPCAVAADPADDKTLDDAIDRALEYLHTAQDKTDGAWRVGQNKDTAITALAVMAFLSAGHVPDEGPYGEAVTKGVQWVLRQQKANGLLAVDNVAFGQYEMYHHGICTLMLAEVAGMAKGKLAVEVRQKLQKAVALILKAQRTEGEHRGGWRYRIQANDSDISVTGWQVMALRAAKNVGCDVPAERIAEAIGFIQRCRDPSTGGFRYFPNGPLTVPCTGTSILALEICGKEQHRTPELLKAGAYVLSNPPTWGTAHFFYSVYYCSQATFQVGGNYWEAFRPKLHEVLLRNQASNGSWLGRDRGSSQNGANYCTAMAVLALTVEYRYLPIYQRSEEPPDKAGKK
jgi:hypothetical protein